MTEYQVDGTVRKKECDKNSSISYLTTAEPHNRVYKVERVIEMIEKENHKFWSYVYKDGEIVEETKIEVEVVHDPDGDYVRTHRDGVEENNLLELPIYRYDSSKGKYVRC